MTKDKTSLKIQPWSILSKAKRSAVTKKAVTIDSPEVERQKISLKKVGLELFFICVFVLLIYSPSLNSPFIFVDDYIMHAFASKLREDNFWLELVLKALVKPLSQPWLVFSFAMDLGYCGVSATGYRLVNIILHTSSCVYLYVLALQIALHFSSQLEIKKPSKNLLPYRIAFAASLLFACHPLATQSVAYIAGRAGELTGVNCLLALNFFLWAFWSDRTFPIVAGYIGAIFCSLMAIETSLDGLAVPLILCFTALLLHRPQSLKSVLTERLWEVLFLSIISLGILISLISSTYSSEFAGNFGLTAPDRLTYLAAQMQGFYDYYLRCVILPFGMSINPPVMISSDLFGPATILGCAVFLAILVFAWIKRRSPFISFPLCIVAVSYLPSVLMWRSDYASDERFYLPTAAICLLAAFAFVNLAKDRTWRSIPNILGLVVILALTSLTIWRERAWSSSLNLWKNAVRVNPTPHSRAMVALIEIEGEKASQAKKEAQSILEKTPDCLPALLTIAQYEFTQKNYLAAKPLLAKALKICEEKNVDAFCRYQVSVLCLWNLLELGESKIPTEAITYLLERYPECDDVNFLAGRIALDQNNPTLAVRYLNKAFSVNRTRPDYLLALGEACLDTGEPTLIRNAYKSTHKLSLHVASPELRIIFAQAALDVGHPDECLTAVDAAISIFDKLNYKIKTKMKARAFYVKSLALLKLGKNTESEVARKEALNLDPEIAKKLKITTISLF